MPSAPDTPSSHLTLQFLAWLDEAPRTYGETMNAWRTSCPRLSIWEDALSDGLVKVESARTMREARVRLTRAGQALLARAAPKAPDAMNENRVRAYKSSLVGSG